MMRKYTYRFGDKHSAQPNAGHANRMAKRLEQEVRIIPGVKVTQKVETNVVFACPLPPVTFMKNRSTQREASHFPEQLRALSVPLT